MGAPVLWPDSSHGGVITRRRCPLGVETGKPVAKNHVRGFPQDTRIILLVAKDQFLLLEWNGTVVFDPIAVRLIPFLLFIQPL